MPSGIFVLFNHLSHTALLGCCHSETEEQKRNIKVKGCLFECGNSLHKNESP